MGTLYQDSIITPGPVHPGQTQLRDKRAKEQGMLKLGIIAAVHTKGGFWSLRLSSLISSDQINTYFRAESELQKMAVLPGSRDIFG